jgi:hypothetical protein
VSIDSWLRLGRRLAFANFVNNYAKLIQPPRLLGAGAAVNLCDRIVFARSPIYQVGSGRRFGVRVILNQQSEGLLDPQADIRTGSFKAIDQPRDNNLINLWRMDTVG